MVQCTKSQGTILQCSAKAPDLTVWQGRRNSLIDCAVAVTGGSRRRGRSAAAGKTRLRDNRPKFAFFVPPKLPQSHENRAWDAPAGASDRGRGKACRVCGPEPHAGFAGACSLLL